MLSRVNSMVFNEDQNQTTTTTTWSQNNNDNELEMGTLSTFKSILEVAAGDDEQDWFNNGNNQINNNNNNMQEMRDLSNFSPSFNTQHENLLLQQTAIVDSSASCSPSPAAAGSVFNNNHIQFFMPPSKTTMPSSSILLNAISNNPLEQQPNFDLGSCENGVFLETQSFNAFGRSNGGVFNDLGSLNFSSNHQFVAQFPHNNGGLSAYPSSSYGGNIGVGNENSLFLNRSKILKPLDNFSSVGSQPTLFQKRAALRKNLANNGGNLGGEICQLSNKNKVEDFEKKNREKISNQIIDMNFERKRKISNGDDGEDVSIDGSNLNYDSDDFLENNCVGFGNNSNNKAEENCKNGGNSSNANSTITNGDPKGKKKGLPAKNLMAERRRRKKLNDRLYMLRSVVPKISKMDRASILGDAIEYLKELLQKINDLHNELESTPPGSLLTPTTSFYPLTPTGTALPSRIKEELCPSAFASPLSSPTGQPARVEVRVREGRAVNIHMFCNRKPGILLSTMRAMDNLGLDIQQAVISCFNGFALDVFRAEQCKEGQEIHPDHIKAILLESAGYHGMI